MDASYQIDYPYHIVEFINVGRKPRQKSVDIVATSWMTYNQKKKKVLVLYPPPPYDQESCTMYNDHLKYQLNPLSDWKEYPVKIKGKASSFDEANEKLKLLHTQDTALTLESDNNTDETEEKAVKKLKQSLLVQQAQKVKNSMNNPPNSNNVDLPDASNQFNTCKKSNLKKIVEPRQLKKTVQSFNASSTNLKEQELPISRGLLTDNPSYSREELLEMPIEFANDSNNNINSSTINNVRSKEPATNSAFESFVLNNFAKVLTELGGLKAEVKRVRNDLRTFKSTAVNNTENRSSVISIQQLKEIYNLDVPFATLQNFEEFDQDLNKNSVLKADIKAIIEMSIDPSLPTSRFLVKVLKLFLEKEVALQYTALKGTAKKKPINSTNFFSIVKDTLKSKNKEINILTTDKEINSALSNTMSNVTGWYMTTRKETQEKDDNASCSGSTLSKSLHSTPSNVFKLTEGDGNSSQLSVEIEESAIDTESEEGQDDDNEDENNEFIKSILGR